MPVDTSSSRGKDTKRSTLGSGGQRSKVKSNEAEDRFGSMAKASFSTPWDRVAFLVCLCHEHHNNTIFGVPVWYDPTQCSSEF